MPNAIHFSAKPPKPPPSNPSSRSPPNSPNSALHPSSANLLYSYPSNHQSYGSITPNKHTTPEQTESQPQPHQHSQPGSYIQPIAASTSFFGLPQSLSSASLRSTLGLHAPPPGHIDWVSLCVVYWITLVSEASRGLMLPSTWPYFNSLGGTKQMLGVFVASFSVGRMATTVPLGYLSDTFSTATVLSIASVIQVLGHFLYAVSPSLTMLFISRVIVGFGSATMSVCRAYLTRAIPAQSRTHHFAYLSGLQFIGFAVLPGAGGLLALLPEYSPFSFMALNGYTYPAYCLVFCNLISVALVYSFFFDPPESSPRNRTWNHGDASDDDNVIRPDVVALVVCLLVNVVFRGVVAEFETVSTPFLMEHFDMTYGQASFDISLIGFFGLFVYLGFKPIAKRFSDRKLVLFGLLMVVAGCLPLSMGSLAAEMSVAWYVLFLGLTWSIAYPIGQTAILALFSKVLAGLPAGGFLGIFSASGSLARVSFAMLAGKMWSDFGRESVFAGILAYIFLAGLLVLGSYGRLKPST